VKLEGPLKEKCLYITVTLGLFESKVFTYYNYCCGPLWKQISLLNSEVKVRRNGPERRSGKRIIAGTAFRLEFQVR